MRCRSGRAPARALRAARRRPRCPRRSDGSASPPTARRPRGARWRATARRRARRRARTPRSGARRSRPCASADHRRGLRDAFHPGAVAEERRPGREHEPGAVHRRRDAFSRAQDLRAEADHLEEGRAGAGLSESERSARSLMQAPRGRRGRIRPAAAAGRAVKGVDEHRAIGSMCWRAAGRRATPAPRPVGRGGERIWEGRVPFRPPRRRRRG